MFNVGDVLRFRITGAKVMVLEVNTYHPITQEGRKEETVYTIRLPNYTKATDVKAMELEALE
jgi:hypothetical protein